MPLILSHRKTQRELRQSPNVLGTHCKPLLSVIAYYFGSFSFSPSEQKDSFTDSTCIMYHRLSDVLQVEKCAEFFLKSWFRILFKKNWRVCVECAAAVAHNQIGSCCVLPEWKTHRNGKCCHDYGAIDETTFHWIFLHSSLTVRLSLDIVITFEWILHWNISLSGRACSFQNSWKSRASTYMATMDEKTY